MTISRIIGFIISLAVLMAVVIANIGCAGAKYGCPAIGKFDYPNKHFNK